MSLLHMALKDVKAEDIDRLRDNAVSESREIDYKQEIIGGSDEDKREFLADVSSFANAGGGDIVFGVKEKRDANGKLSGEPEDVVGLPGVSRDAEVLRLLSSIRDGIAPRIQGVDRHWVDRPDGDPVLVLRIPRSWTGPHMVTFKNLSRFYARHANGKVQLDVGEIGQAFRGGETRRNELRAFRAERVGRIVSDETFVPVGSGPKVIFHGIPLQPSRLGEQILAEPYFRRGSYLVPFDMSGGTSRHNLDGYVTYGREIYGVSAYVQVFRDGALEAVGRASTGRSKQNDDRLVFNATDAERDVIQGLHQWIKTWTQYREPGPIMLGLTITGVRHHHIMTDWPGYDLRPFTIDRDVLLIPEVVIEDFSKESEELLRPLLDGMWQAGGWEGSPHFDDEGRSRLFRR